MILLLILDLIARTKKQHMKKIKAFEDCLKTEGERDTKILKQTKHLLSIVGTITVVLQCTGPIFADEIRKMGNVLSPEM